MEVFYTIILTIYMFFISVSNAWLPRSIWIKLYYRYYFTAISHCYPDVYKEVTRLRKIYLNNNDTKFTEVFVRFTNEIIEFVEESDVEIGIYQEDFTTLPCLVVKSINTKKYKVIGYKLIPSTCPNRSINPNEFVSPNQPYDNIKLFHSSIIKQYMVEPPDFII
jgi:hypothetical protein